MRILFLFAAASFLFLIFVCFFCRRFIRAGREVFVSDGRLSVAAPQKNHRRIYAFIGVLAAGFLVRVIGAVCFRGYETDINCFLSWADLLFEHGMENFYTLDVFTDYPPGYMYILYGIGFLRARFGIDTNSVLSIVLTKMPAILCDLGIAVLVYKIARARFYHAGALTLTAAFLLTPTVFLDSAVWGQTDSIFTLCIALMCVLVTQKKLIPAYFVFALGILLKPQSLIFTPVLLFGIIDQIFLDSLRHDTRRVFWKKFLVNLLFGLLAILLIVLLLLPFGFKNAVFQYTQTLGSYGYASVNAYNFWTVIGKNWANQNGTLFGITYQAWGMVFIVATVIFSAVINFKSKDRKSKYYFTAALIVICMFTFSVRMHERYLYPAVVLLLFLFAVRPKKIFYFAWLFAGAISFCNMAHVLFFYDPSNFDPMQAVPIYVGIGAVAFAVFCLTLAVKYFICPPFTAKKKESHDRREEKKFAKEPKASEKGKKDRFKKRPVIRPSRPRIKFRARDFVLLFGITAVYAVIAFVNLGDRTAPNTEYSFAQEGTAVFDFGEPVKIAQIWDYLGAENNPSYVLSYATDLDEGWTELYGKDNPLDFGFVFCWNCADVNVYARYVLLTTTALTQNDSVMELVFTDMDGNMLLPVNGEQYHNLFDEQDCFTGRATNKNGTYFDEIYHARTAYELIHHLYCYENTHPPLGKILIACGVLIFGMNPFGWRFMGTLFGVFMLPVFYLLAKRFFKQTWLCATVTVLFAFDFMHFVQTRIATIDVFATFFILLAYLFMALYAQKSFYDRRLKETFVPLGLCGIAMGLSWACKWTGLYASIGLCVIFFAVMFQRFREYRYAKKNLDGETAGITHREIADTFVKKFWCTVGFCVIFFLLVPVCIYTLSYLPVNDGTGNGLLRRVLDSQVTMYNYHSHLEAEHPYSSTWLEWPIMRRPTFYYAGQTAEGLKEGISAFGNPLVWWTGIFAFFMVLYCAIKERDRRGFLLLVGYLSQYLPWVFVGRCTFIYHYFPSVPFVVLLIGFCMEKTVKKMPKLKPLMFVYTGCSVLLFVLFYPVLAAMPVSDFYVNTFLRWFSTWVLVL